MEAVGSNWTHDQLVPSDVIPLSYISTSLHCWSHELMLHTVCTPWTVRWVLDSAAFIRVPDVVLSAWSSLANSLKTHSQGDFSHRTDTGDVLFLLLSVWTLMSECFRNCWSALILTKFRFLKYFHAYSCRCDMIGSLNIQVWQIKWAYKTHFFKNFFSGVFQFYWTD